MNKIFRLPKFVSHIPIIITLIITVFFLFPFYWMIVGSVTSQATLYETSISRLFPSEFFLTNYTNLFDANPVIKWFRNSLFFAILTTLVVVFTNMMAGYSLAKKKFIGSSILFILFIGTLMLPRQVLIVPMYITMRDLDLIGNSFSVMLPAMAWPLGIFLVRQFMHTIPNEILESASIDGSSELRTFTSIVLPLSKPAIGVLIIITFMGMWNDYLWQLVIINDREQLTLPIGIAALQNEFAPDYGILFAGATIAAIPMIAIFLLFQKYFTNGLTLGAVKG